MSTMGGIAMYKKIDSDIMKFARAFGKAIVARATVEINEYAIKALYDSYYSQYNPTYYQRTEQMLFNSYERFMVTSDTRCEGGIRIKNKGVFYNLGGRNITTEEIIDNVWMRGSHGWRISYYKPLPRSQMSRKKEKDLFFKNWTNETRIFAHNTGYVTDVWGRRRRLPDILRQKYEICLFAEQKR